MTRIFIDTEFNGFGGELLSMALVAEDGREWYGVLPEPPNEWDEWVFDNVRPHFDAEKPTIKARSREEFRISAFAFLSAYSNPTIVADWYTDLVHFFSLFGGEDHSESLAFSCKAELVMLEGDLPSAVPHNALSDARAIRDLYGLKHPPQPDQERAA